MKRFASAMFTTLSLTVVSAHSVAQPAQTQNEAALASARAEILGLERAGLPWLALQAAQRNPGAVTPPKMRQLEADYAAELTRLAVITTRQESERFRIADRALAMYDDLIAKWTPLGAPAARDVARVRIDRLEALRARNLMASVIHEYQTLLRDGIAIPPYAMAHVAAAHLHQRRPDDARRFYELVNDTDNDLPPETRLDNQIGLFYSLVESEQHDQARRVIEAAVHEQPIWLYRKGNPNRVGNPLRLHAEHTEALSYLYADDTVEAEERLAHMVTAAPNNAGLRASMAAVYRERDQPRRADTELKIAETLEPRAIAVEAEQFQVAMDLGQWEHAEALLDDLQQRTPEHALTLNATRRWANHNKAELQVSAQGGLVSDTPVSGENDLTMETVLYSAPINYNWRPFAGVGYAQGDFEEGSTHFRWTRAGVQWQGKGLTAEIEGSAQRYGHGTRPGARAAAYYDLNDHWQIGGEVAWRSIETPVRALHHNISSNSLTAYTRWRANEQREWSLTATASRFSDSNKRLSLLLSGRERLYTSPHIKADALLGIYASRNSQRDAPYFNPRADIEVLPAIRVSHILYRRYERRLEHALTLGGGIYAQRGYGSGGVAAATYEVQYDHNRDISVGASLTGTTRPYDGNRERELRFMLNLNIRF